MIAGLDLASKETNPSGVCTLDSLDCRVVYRDQEILKALKGAQVVAVDAPLTMEKPWRKAEKELLKMGYRPLPLSLPSMVELHKRAVRLKEMLKGTTVIETFIQPMRTAGALKLKEIMGWGRDQLDAFLAALVAKYYREGKAVAVGEEPVYILTPEIVEKEVGRLFQNLPFLGKR